MNLSLNAIMSSFLKSRIIIWSPLVKHFKKKGFAWIRTCTVPNLEVVVRTGDPLTGMLFVSA